MSRNNSVELRDVDGNHKRWLTLDECHVLLKTEGYNDYVEKIKGRERLIISPKTGISELTGTIKNLGEHEIRANAGLGTPHAVLNVRAKIRAWPHVINERAAMFAAGKPSMVVSMTPERIAEIDRGQIGYS